MSEDDAPDDHNDVRWLALANIGQGWHVMRICPCHWGERISVVYLDQDHAEAVRQWVGGFG